MSKPRSETIFLTTLVAANLTMFATGLVQQSWDALRIAIIIGPAVNVGFLITGIVTTIRRRRNGYPVSATTWLVAPPGASAILAIALLPAALHGC